MIAEALDALPKDLGGDLLLKAEALLVEEAAKLGPQELRRPRRPGAGATGPRHRRGSRVPAAARRRTPRQRRHPAEPAPPRGRIHRPPRPDPRPRRRPAARLPQRLHRTPPPTPAATDQQTVETPFGPLTPAAEDEFANLPLARQRGEAFVALLENIPVQRPAPPRRHRHQPDRSSSPTTPSSPTSPAGIAATSTGDRITAGQARRLACQAGILPAVMGGEVRGPRPGPRVAAVQATPAQGDEPARQGMHHGRLLDARGVLRSPPQGPLVPRRQDRPQGRQAALPLPPPPRPRPRLDHPPPPQRTTTFTRRQ